LQYNFNRLKSKINATQTNTVEQLEFF
jgi:hypothetical protein